MPAALRKQGLNRRAEIACLPGRYRSTVCRPRFPRTTTNGRARRSEKRGSANECAAPFFSRRGKKISICNTTERIKG